MSALIQPSVSFTLRVRKYVDGWSNECWLEGEFIGRRGPFATREEAVADRETAQAEIVADLASKGIAAHRRAEELS